MSRSHTAPAAVQAPSNTASLYVRLSREAGTTNLSKEGMIADLRALCAAEGLREVALHVDDGLSGALRNRPEFVAWLNDARHGRASTLVAWHVDRMTREGVNVAALILDTIEGKDPETGRVVRQPVRLLDTKGLDSSGDETAFRMRFVIAAEIARAERERMRDRSRARARRLAESGRWGGGPLPYGVTTAPAPGGAGSVLVEHPEEADALREALRRLLDGQTPARVARWLTAHGPKPRRAKSWTRTTLLQALTSETTAKYVFTASERAQIARVTRTTRRPPQTRQPLRLLSGVLRCYSCDSRLVVFTRPSDGLVSYRCQTRARGGECSGALSIAAAGVEAAVEAAWLDGWGALEETVSVTQEDENAERVAALDEEIETVGAEVLALKGTERVAALERLERLEAEREDLAARPSSALAVLRHTGRTYADAWHEGTVEDRRDLLLATAGPLRIGPGRKGRPTASAHLARVLNAYRLDPAMIDAEEGIAVRDRRE